MFSFSFRILSIKMTHFESLSQKVLKKSFTNFSIGIPWIKMSQIAKNATDVTAPIRFNALAVVLKNIVDYFLLQNFRFY